MVNPFAVSWTLLAATAVLLIPPQDTSAARVLGVFLHHGYSHHVIFLSYMRALADRGHDVHVISNYESRHPNIRDIDIRGSIQLQNNNFSIPDAASLKSFGVFGALSNMMTLYHLAPDTEAAFHLPAVRRLIDDPTVTYDLIVTEHFNSELPLGFVAKYRVPFILFSSCPLLPSTAPLVGQPHQIAYKPSTLSGLPARMDLSERLVNTAVTLLSVAVFRLFHRVWSQRAINEHFGLDVDLDAVASNVSLVFVNTHWSVTGVAPTVPAVVEVGGLHIEPPKQLPADIQKYIDEAEHGVIYFCMGSVLAGETFPAVKRQMFLNVFKKIPQRVLWKWEGELHEKPSNVMIRNWMPQRDILAHPNVKLFISHGGLLGTTETVYEGVPILSIPMFGDQLTNVKAVMDKGAAEMMSYDDLNENEIFAKITSMLTNPLYKQRAKELSETFRDRPMSPLETAVYWTEYVIRHKGAPHLRSAAVGMPWYKYYLIDVLFVILLSVATVILFLYYLIFKIILRLTIKKIKEKQT